ncbi:TMEM175 family protein [Streptomyces yaanensis]|uniref:TMEM175 family protein n=1 Tax=Streptomyces yaanensis TaxID=1142239 RepID=A0ABV7SCT4_9ACTN|nr:TMEM175 family protein [Streptomyces sp. CGMCC 4.7035]WNB98411.1 TMEM175 family protein [Streptomyces sp. CGMCC 4.7035]
MAHYHRIAGQELGRLAALSDGIFAVAMTLLILELKVPAERAWDERALWQPGAVEQEEPVAHVLTHVGPEFAVCFLGFLTLGMFWLGQQTQLSRIERSDRTFAWIHLMFLFGVSVMPFATGLMTAFTSSRLALLVYWADLLFLGLAQLAGLRYAELAGLLKADTTTEDLRAIRRRIAVVQALYAGAVLLAVFSTYVSIGVIILLQINSALSPRIRPLNRF